MTRIAPLLLAVSLSGCSLTSLLVHRPSPGTLCPEGVRVERFQLPPGWTIAKGEERNGEALYYVQGEGRGTLCEFSSQEYSKASQGLAGFGLGVIPERRATLERLKREHVADVAQKQREQDRRDAQEAAAAAARQKAREDAEAGRQASLQAELDERNAAEARRAGAERRQKSIHRLAAHIYALNHFRDIASVMICEAQDSISISQSDMRDARRAAAISGYIDKGLMLEAGESIVADRDWEAQVRKTLKRITGKSPLPCAQAKNDTTFPQWTTSYDIARQIVRGQDIAAEQDALATAIGPDGVAEATELARHSPAGVAIR